MHRPLRTPSERFLLAGLATSATFHALALAVLALDLMWPFLSLLVTLRRPPEFSIALQARLDDDPLLDDARLGPVPLITAMDDRRLAEAAAEMINVDVSEPDEERAAALPVQVSVSVQAVAERAAEQTADENLKQLNDLTGQLNRISGEKSVEEMAGKLGQWLGTGERATRPAEGKVQGEFDFATAQLHDVERKRDPTGAWLYTAVLIDAAGRTRRSAMEVAEGESAYRTMQLLKSNPLAEMVYRRVAMSLLDNIIQAAQQAERAVTLPAEQQPAASPAPKDEVGSKPPD